MNVDLKPYATKIFKINIKKFIILQITVFLLLFTLLFPGADPGAEAVNTPPSVHYNGAVLQFDVSPLFFQETPLFPLRGILENRGFILNWEPAAQRVVLVGPGRVGYLYLGNPLYSVNGVVYRTVQPPEIVQGRVMVAMDFLQQCIDWEEFIWDEKGAALHLGGSPGNAENGGQASPPLPGRVEIEAFDMKFIAVLLPTGKEVTVGEHFKIVIAAPFVEGIYAYAVRLKYDPEQIAVQRLENPAFNSRQDFSWNKIDAAAGVAEYLQTTLGYQEKIPPRDPLVILEARALRAGVLSLPGEALQVNLLDNTATPMPAGLEEKTLYITAFSQAGS
ncbi:MAG: hypothetical protein GX334_05675 [Firmicutes bacterium]|nr:hypothetical protein [Bacillota bacterium]